MRLHYSLLLLTALASCSGNIPEDKKTFTTDTSAAVAPPAPGVTCKIDTVGCVVPPGKMDTTLGFLNIHINDHCTDQHFADTTTAWRGDGVVFTTVGLYNYREIELLLSAGGIKKHLVLSNVSFADSIPNDFLTRGMLDNPRVLRLLPGDTSVIMQADLFAPSDARYIITFTAGMRGHIYIHSTHYEGPF